MRSVTVVFPETLGTISPEIYGHFSEHIGGVFYDGLWVGEDSPVENIRGFRKRLVDSFKALNPPVLRWPGGCFAETYNWRDGIGERSGRPRRLNWWYSRDGRAESNEVGTHEFMDFCEMVGAQPYFAANITSTTPLDIREWVEYCNIPAGVTTLSDERAKNGHPAPFDVKYWGIGNENWGGGGNMSPEDCVSAFLRYTAVINSVQDGLKYIICGPNGNDVEWTRRLLKEYTGRKYRDAKLYGVSMHYYCGTAGTPQEFTRDEWYQLLFQANFMERVIQNHRHAMDEFDPERKIALLVDEWGCWHKDGTGPSKGYNLFEQQSNMRDAVVAALTLNIFNNRCDWVKMANVAQLCNNLHSLYLAHGDAFVETPNYYVFRMFREHMGARHLHTVVTAPYLEREGFAPMKEISASASERDGKVTVTMANLSLDTKCEVALSAIGGKLSGDAELEILSSSDPHTCNTFEDAYAVVPKSTRICLSEGAGVILPPASVARLTVG